MLTNLEDLPSPREATGEETTPQIYKFRRPVRSEAPPAPTWSQRAYFPLRRVLDFTAALALTLIAVPTVFLAALAVRLTSRGPAFYTQVRTGRKGKPFTIYKLRSMIHNCESLTGPRWTIPDDPRITPVGWLLRRTHIDELPQLLNVLKGEMSLVGPRPERPEFVAELEQAIPGYAHRHEILPGITGLAQVQLAPDTDIENVREKLVYDLHYVKNLSLVLDLRILLATGLHMLGVSFARLSRLGVVPTVASPRVPAMPAMASRVQKQAA